MTSYRTSVGKLQQPSLAYSRVYGNPLKSSQKFPTSACSHDQRSRECDFTPASSDADNLWVKSNLQPPPLCGKLYGNDLICAACRVTCHYSTGEYTEGSSLVPMILISWWHCPCSPHWLCPLPPDVINVIQSKLHHLIIPRANKLDRHKENILKSSWGYTGTDASESNPSRVNCRGLGAKSSQHFLTPCPWPLSPRWDEWIILSARDETGVGPHWSRGGDADTWLADADLVLSAVISKDHGRNRRNQSADVMESRVTCHHISNKQQ